MNITILTYGSRGDVQPFLPLSLGLMARGHSVELAAPSQIKELVEGYGIGFVSLAGEPEDLSRRLNDAGFNFIKLVRELMDHAIEIGADVYVKLKKPVRMLTLLFTRLLMWLVLIRLPAR